MKLLILFALVTLVTGSPMSLPAAVGPMASTGHVVGGDVTTIKEVPHQVSIQSSGSHTCGGSIISAEWVLTAAHCMQRPLSSYTVRAGTDRLDAEHGTLHTLVKIIEHENYKTSIRGIPSDDIALLRVKEPFRVDETRRPTLLYNGGEESVAGADAKISGWGRTNSGTPLVLHAATVPIVSKEECNKAYAGYGGIPHGQVCAAYPKGGVDTCQGDSGGPMSINGRLAGIVSWGNGCGIPGYPGAYTEVAYYRPWIREHTGL